MWNKFLLETFDETEGTEAVGEIMQLCNSIASNSENITPEDVRYWMECNKMDEGFEILNGYEIVSSLIAIEEEIGDDEVLVRNQKSTVSLSEKETMLLSAPTGLKCRRRQIQLTQTYFCVRYGSSPHRKLELQRHRGNDRLF